MVKAQKFVYAEAFKGEPTINNFRLEEEELRDIEDNEILCKAIYISVDPYIRPLMASYPINHDMLGRQIAKVISSKNNKYPVCSLIFGNLGWRTYTVVRPFSSVMDIRFKTENDAVYLLPDFGKFPISYGLGCLGPPGIAAYFGLLKICKPQEGETVVISGAAGAVGCLVGQIAKIKCCLVIGFAGSDDKCKALKDEYQFDHAFNYKTENIVECLKGAAPNGVDCYFDNVGGQLSSLIISRMKHFGRIAVCGNISQYNSIEEPKVSSFLNHMIVKELKMEGFLLYRWADEYMNGINHILCWLEEGKLKYDETITKGFENLPKAFIGMFRGNNFGKTVVEI